jgi:multidrug efflux pump subunit AcrB
MNLGIAAFGVRKPVVVNLLMAAILVTGLIAGMNLRKQFFPEVDPEIAIVNMPYPGAAPEEVEQSLAIKIEDAFDNIETIDELRTTIAEGGGGITIQFKEGADVETGMDDVERAIDGLQDLPTEAEEITAQLIEPRMPVIRVAVHGDMEPAVLKQAIRTIRDDLRELPGMGEVLIGGVVDYEVQIDVDELAMLEYGLSLPAVSDTIRAWMTDIPGGTIKTDTGNVSLRTMGVEERADAIARIPLIAEADGRIVRVGDIATITEGFVDEDVSLTYNVDPSADLTIFKVGPQDIVHMARMVRAYVAGRNGEPYTYSTGERFGKLAAQMSQRPGQPPAVYQSDYELAWEKGAYPTRPLPEAATVGAATDLARFVEGRMDLLTRNAIYGAILVFAVLLLFLNWRVAFWVGAGLTTAIAGTLLLMAYLDITLNLLTMFGLIVVMGLLVDDAIVVAENIQTHHDKQGEDPTNASIDGTNEVFWPVVATVLTSIAAFLPLTFIKGQIGTLLGALPLVVACALAMSLIESLLILPSHMGHSLSKRDKARPNKLSNLLRRYEDWRDRIILDKVAPGFARLLAVLLRYRYLTLCTAVMALTISFGMVAGKRVGFVFMSNDDAESVMVNIRMPIGTPIEQTRDAVHRIESAVLAQPEVTFVETVVGASSDIETGMSNGASSHIAQMFIELSPVEERDTPSPVVIDNIRLALLGQIDDVERINYEAMAGGPGGPDISIRLVSADPQTLRRATAEVRQLLAGYPQLFDIADDSNEGRQEAQVRVYEDAQALGLSNLEINRQLRGFLFGLEAHTYAEREEDIDLRVRIDEETRGSIYQVQNAWLINAMGAPVPMREIVEVRSGTSFASINRVDGERAVTVTAAVETDTSPEDITAELKAAPLDEHGKPVLDERGNPLPSPLEQIEQRYPGLKVGFAGRQEQMADAFSTLPLGFGFAMLMIYVILAWLFQSYFQPILVMCVVPFATIGLIWGHYILGFDITFLSLIGFVALSGIVVNDSLILVQFFNQRRQAGDSVYDALVAAGQARLRAIFLTTVTTVFGLLPLLLEQSFQARFLIPMGISIAAGLISATVMILVVLPCIMLAFDDLKRVVYFIWHGQQRPADFKPEGRVAGTA